MDVPVSPDGSRCGASCWLSAAVSLPSREGSRLYSYLLMGQNHYPETTQPTTSPCTNIRSVPRPQACKIIIFTPKIVSEMNPETSRCRNVLWARIT
ncbi:hypothetical protein QQF64_023478 [Cirrhinus molitorella]|uniref:Uncharacterized protein n=1 Tax=Cirrhinus molitorella TaxID=172907 RepID=A0ABR3L5G8_9TELE